MYICTFQYQPILVPSIVACAGAHRKLACTKLSSLECQAQMLTPNAILSMRTGPCPSIPDAVSNACRHISLHAEAIAVPSPTRRIGVSRTTYMFTTRPALYLHLQAAYDFQNHNHAPCTHGNSVVTQSTTAVGVIADSSSSWLPLRRFICLRVWYGREFCRHLCVLCPLHV